jgi:phosphoenolpyruvate-protein phosphotransferase (PTS system enzyme I)
MEDLEEHNVPFNRDVPVGMMVEVPAAVMMIDHFVEEVDFVSIGTNDLIQYTLAIDRTDDTVSHLYDPLHPAVLHLVAHSIHAAARAKIPISLCGEMAGDVLFTRLLLGFGLREFSMHPADLLPVKQQVLKSNVNKLARLADKLLKTGDHERFSELAIKINIE